MANNIHELAQETFDSGNYQLALELFEHILRYSDKLGSQSEYEQSTMSIDSYIGYGDSLARCGRVLESFNVFAFICNRFGYSIPLQKLKHLTAGLLGSVNSVSIVKSLQQQQQQQQKSQKRPSQQQQMLSNLQQDQNCMKKYNMNTSHRTKLDDPNRSNKSTDNYVKNNDHNSIFKCTKWSFDHNETSIRKIDSNDYQHNIYSDSSNDNYYDSDYSILIDYKLNNNSKICNSDPFLCPICEHVLFYPVTMSCGHTFCRDCVSSESQCQVCDKWFLRCNNSLKQDVLISRLVEKWWMPHIQAKIINDKAQTLLRQNTLDEALKSCNESLDKCK